MATPKTTPVPNTASAPGRNDVHETAKITGDTPLDEVMKMMDRHPKRTKGLIADYLRVRLADTLIRGKAQRFNN